MLSKEMKTQALKDFLEVSASAQIDGHSADDGSGCKGHDEKFTAKAEELLRLIEDENYGYEASADGKDAPTASAALDGDQISSLIGSLSYEALGLLYNSAGSELSRRNDEAALSRGEDGGW